MQATVVPRRILVIVAACAAIGVACAPPVDGPDSGEPAVEPEDAGVNEPEDAGPPARPDDCPAPNPFVYEVRGSVLTETGAPAAGAKAQTCVRTFSGQFLCLQPSDVDAVGDFVVPVPSQARCMTRATSRVLIPLADAATVYCPVEIAGADGVIEIETSYTILETVRPTSIPPVGDETETREVEFASGLVLDVVPDDVYGQDYVNIAARSLAVDDVPACALADAPENIEGLIAFSPEGDLPVGKGVGARIPVSGLAAGTAVEIYVQGGLLCTLDDGTALEEALWGLAGTANVDPTGTFIDVSGDVSIPCLNWLAWRTAP